MRLSKSSPPKDIKSTPSQIKDEHIYLTNKLRLIVQTISNCSCRRLIDHAKNV
ncbi:hypothetical protein HanXRQr2_Chr10g0429131 [Helianthus annuus]|uniref:Uncharacterized protein n=1 Tax=Helianthus annuus TaxID=4232 RepID=A0A9K3HVW0_HELAN|nr:hypothetical protein HanXRQr2_Chr10g0429131 [Helianthus annuus]